MPNKRIINCTMPEITQFLQSVKLPVMPEVAHALIRTFEDSDADVQTVTRIIAKDPALTATLLRMANSAIFGLSRQVHTLDAAVSVLGMSHIRARALSVCMAHEFVFPKDINRLEFWRSCMRCAGYARWLAAARSLDEHQSWLMGMMLRLGELMIAQARPDCVQVIERQPCAPGERWERERAAVGFDEGQISAGIAEHWDFPDAFSQALRDCTSAPGQPRAVLGSVLELAARLADHPQPSVAALADWPSAVVTALGLDTHRLGLSLPDAETLNDISALQPG